MSQFSLKTALSGHDNPEVPLKNARPSVSPSAEAVVMALDVDDPGATPLSPPAETTPPFSPAPPEEVSPELQEARLAINSPLPSTNVSGLGDLIIPDGDPIFGTG